MGVQTSSLRVGRTPAWAGWSWWWCWRWTRRARFWRRRGIRRRPPGSRLPRRAQASTRSVSLPVCKSLLLHWMRTWIWTNSRILICCRVQVIQSSRACLCGGDAVATAWFERLSSKRPAGVRGRVCAQCAAKCESFVPVHQLDEWLSDELWADSFRANRYIRNKLIALLTERESNYVARFVPHFDWNTNVTIISIDFSLEKCLEHLQKLVSSVLSSTVLYTVNQGFPDLVGSRPKNLGLKTTKGPNSKF